MPGKRVQFKGPQVSQVSEGTDLTSVLDEIGTKLPELVCTVDDYILGEEIGRGGFGRVLRATGKRTGQVVALKEIFAHRLDGERLRRYILEIETMVHLKSPYIVSICGFSTRPPHCIVSTFIAGGALSKWTHPRRDDPKPPPPLNPTQNTIVALGVAYGLQLMHSKNILHRDLKCANILLDENGYPYICDLGIARFDEQHGAEKTMKLGTPSYMAPELMDPSGSRAYNSMVDIYSYGVVLYEVVERRRALKGIHNIQELYDRVYVGGERPTISDRTPAMCRKLIEKCMSRQPSDRYTATEIISFIKSHMNEIFPGTKKALVAKYEKWAAGVYKSQQKKKKKGDIDGPAHIFAAHTPTKAQAATPRQPVKGFSLEESLRNPNAPTFLTDLHDVAEKLPLDQLASVLPTFIAYFKSPNAPLVQVLLMEVINHLVARAPPTVAMLAGAGFFECMPINKDTIVRALDLMLDLAAQAPQKIRVEFKGQFVRLIDIAPDKGIAVLAFCFARIPRPSTALCGMALDVAIESTASIIKAKSGGRVLNLLNRLALRSPDFRRDRGPDIGSFACRCLASTEQPTIIAAYSLIATDGIPVPHLASQLIIPHLSVAELYPRVYRALAKAESVDLTPQLLVALVTRPDEPKTWAIISRLAERPDGPDFMLHEPYWLCQEAPKASLQIFIVIATNPAARKLVYALPQYSALMALNGQLQDDHVLMALPFVIAQGPTSWEVLEQLRVDTFWHYFLESVMASQSGDVHRSAMWLVDVFLSSGYIDEFGAYAEFLISILDRDDLAFDIIRLLADMSFRPEAAAVIAQSNLRDYFEQLRGDEECREFADKLLANLG
jgi:serine/threonine protein kinase